MAASPKHKQINRHFRKSNGFEKDHNIQKVSSPRSNLGTQASSCMAFSLEPHLGRILKLAVGKKIYSFLLTKNCGSQLQEILNITFL